MMYLGRNSYFLGKDVGVEDTNLLTGLFSVKSADGSTPLSSWQHISNVTDFYAGQSDDITYTEWQSFLNNVLGSGFSSAPENMASTATIDSLYGGIGQLRLPKIFSSVVVNPDIGSLTKADLLKQSLGFRIFGQKFTFDAWILNDLLPDRNRRRRNCRQCHPRFLCRRRLGTHGPRAIPRSSF